MPTPITSIGPETRINVTTASDQKAPSVTGLADGGWIVTWQSNNQDGSGYGIYQQRYDKTGAPVSATDVRVNLTTSNSQADPSVTALADGGWVVTWVSQNQDVGWNGGIYQQRYDKNGVALFTTDRLVNSSVTYDQSLPSVTALTDGGWVVTWISDGQDGSGAGVYQQRYNASGTAIGAETRVNALTDGSQTRPVVTALKDGGWIVAWESHSSGPTGHSLYQQRYDASGTASAVTDLPVETTASDYKVQPSITALSDGGWVVTWTTYSAGGDIVQQRFDKNGVALFTTPQRVNVTTGDLQEPATVTALKDGGWVVVWQSVNQDGSGSGIYLQAYDKEGNAAGAADMLVNTTTSGNQEMPSVTALNDGWIATWQSAGQDGDGYGVYQKRYFTTSPPTDVTLSITSVNEDVTGLIATLTGVDPNTGDTFTFTLAEDASGKFEIVGNELRLKAGQSLDYETAASHAIKITVTDQTGLSVTKSVTLTVKDVVENHAPTGVALSRTAVDEDVTGLIATLDGIDADSGDTFTFALAEDLSGKFEIVGGELRLKSGQNLDYETAKSHTIKIAVTDKAGASVTKTVLITVNDIADTNDAPVDIRLNGGLGTAITEDATIDTFIGVLSATDKNGDPVTFSFAAGGDAGGLFVIDPLTNQIKLAPGAVLDYESLATGKKHYTLSVIADDGKGGASLPQTITIGITDVNERPDTIITGAGPSGALVVDEGAASGTLVASLAGADPEGDAVSYALVDNAGGRFKIVGSEIRVANGALLDFEDAAGASHNLTLLVIDAKGMTQVKTVTVNVLGKNDAPADILLSKASIAENASSGTEVGVLSTIDQDAGETFSYTLVDDAGGRFTLDPTGTKILVADGSKLDFEAAPSHTIRVLVTDKAGLTFEKSIIIALTDVPEAAANHAPVDVTLTGGAKGNASVDEAAGTETVVGSLGTVDLDAGDSHSYILLDDAGGRFKLDAAGTRIVVANGSLIDHEATTSYTIKVQASDGKGGVLVKTIVIAVNNVNEAPADILAVGEPVDEGASKNVFVCSLGVADEDASGTYVYELVDNAGGRFKLGADGRSILVADGALLDYEKEPFHDVKVRVTDGVHSIERVIRITLNDVVEAPPNDAPTDITLSAASVAENASNGTVIGSLSATDPNTGDTFTYVLIDDADGRFEIFGGNLRVKDGSRLDHEAASAHSITVRVTDKGGLSFDKSFTIALIDVPDETGSGLGNRSPIDITFSDGAKGNGSVDENADTGAEVGVLGAVDPDLGDSFTYTLLDDAGGRFKLDATRILVANGSVIDYETASAYTIKVQVSDNKGGTFTKAIAIAVNNVNEKPADIILSGETVDENAAYNTFVGSLSALDPDASGSYVYELLDNADGRFKLGADGKSILAANGALLDYEAATFHDIKVRVKDGAHSFEKVIRITLKDVAEAPVNTAPISITLSGFSVTENAKNGTVVGLLGAADSNAGDTFTYALVDDAGGLFEIFNDKLRVKDGSRLDYEDATVHTVKVRVTDKGGLSFEKEFSIHLNDVDETPVNHAPVIAAIPEGKKITDATDNGAAVNPFRAVTFADVENDTLTATISFNGADGDLIVPLDLVPDGGSAGMSGGIKTYTFTGKAETLALILRMVQFNPTDRPDAGAGSVVSTTFTIKVSDAAHAAAPFINEDVAVRSVVANRAPRDILLTGDNAVREAAAGDVVGTLSAADQAGSSFKYALTDSAGGRFRLDGDRIVADNGLLIDYEQAQSHTIKVLVSDGSLAFEKVFVVNVTDWTGENITGSAAADLLRGGVGNDTLTGGSGDDVLYGGIDNDTLRGNTGRDSFVFDSKLDKSRNVDKIQDFSVRDDTIRLENAIFSKLGSKTGTLNKAFFTIGTKAKDSNDFIVYDNKSGALYYDADGSGRGGAIKFAQLDKNLKMTAADFMVI